MNAFGGGRPMQTIPKKVSETLKGPRGPWRTTEDHEEPSKLTIEFQACLIAMMNQASSLLSADMEYSLQGLIWCRAESCKS